MDALSTQAVVSYLVVQILGWLKRTPLVPWVTAHTSGLNRFLAATLAALAAMGIHVRYDAGAGSLLITGLALTSVLTFAVEWIRGWIMQELLYTVLKGKIQPDGHQYVPVPR